MSSEVLDGPDPPAAIMAAEVADVTDGVIRVTVPDLDGGRTAYRAFGHFPDAAAGDAARVALDGEENVVLLAWEPADG